ncbi:MAG TPA: hypothetical protein VNH13_03810 [Candidatus Acidoferrales bacterium]|jgi:hypothetical protein|nr:hypothetical protein [Candidatus Acidoferrales bacterium]
MTYRPILLKQGDGSQCQWHNCNCASHAMAVDRDWLGAKPVGLADRISPKPIRARINVFCPGTSMAQNQKAVLATYGTHMEPRFDVPWDTFVDGLVAGRGAVVSVMYKVVHGTPYDACRTFDGRHALYVNERRWNAELQRYEALVYDPLADHRLAWIPKGPQWWPMPLLRRAMLASYSSDGGESVECAFTRNTNGPVKKALYAKDTVSAHIGRYRAGPDVASADLGFIEAGDMVSVVATVQGKPWTVNGHQGTTWYRINAVGGVTAANRFGPSVVHAAQGWFTGPTGAQ